MIRCAATTLVQEETKNFKFGLPSIASVIYPIGSKLVKLKLKILKVREEEKLTIQHNNNNSLLVRHLYD